MALGPIVPQPAMQQYEALAVDSTAFTAGRVLGGLGAVAQGIGEAGAGLTAIGGGGLFCTTGVGCLLGGGEAVVAGGVVLAHGASAAVAGAAEAGDQLGIMFAKKKDKPKSEELSSWNQSEAKRLSKKSLSEQEKALKQYEKTLKEHEKKYADSLKQGQTSKEVNTLRDIMKFLTDLITSRKK